ncbi:hypothetical protein CRG98_039689, partial [Punica granatum]
MEGSLQSTVAYAVDTKNLWDDLKESIEPLPNLNKVYKMLVNEERQKLVTRSREVMPESAVFLTKEDAELGRTGGSRWQSSAEGKRTYSYYGKMGHTKNTCWALIGYPSWHSKSKVSAERRPGPILGKQGSGLRGKAQTQRGPDRANVAQAVQTSSSRAERLEALPDEQFQRLLSMLSQNTIDPNRLVDTPQQNGRVERKYRHILNVARALMFQGSLPTRFWGECVSIAVHLINITPMPLLDNKNPHERQTEESGPNSADGSAGRQSNWEEQPYPTRQLKPSPKVKERPIDGDGYSLAQQAMEKDHAMGREAKESKGPTQFFEPGRTRDNADRTLEERENISGPNEDSSRNLEGRGSDSELSRIEFQGGRIFLEKGIVNLETIEEDKSNEMVLRRSERVSNRLKHFNDYIVHTTRHKTPFPDSPTSSDSSDMSYPIE